MNACAYSPDGNLIGGGEFSLVPHEFKWLTRISLFRRGVAHVEHEFEFRASESECGGRACKRDRAGVVDVFGGWADGVDEGWR